ncbi:Ff.00g133290.m01.CDS01 [Fusarium sp. VM40]|nr:Ff.00g133290.m01.CDS01 [Fusarium sp. VM40]
MSGAGMRLKTTLGTETFTAGEGKSAIRSCIDLTFVSPSLNDSCQSCEVYKRNPWPNNDHRPIRTIFNIEPFRDTRLYYQFDETDEKVFNNSLASGLPPLDELKARKLDMTEAEEMTRNICSSLKTAIDKTVPTKLAFPPPICRPMDPKARDLMEGDGIASGHSETVPDKPNCRTIRRREERAEKKKQPNTNRDARYEVVLSTNGK